MPSRSKGMGELLAGPIEWHKAREDQLRETIKDRHDEHHALINEAICNLGGSLRRTEDRLTSGLIASFSLNLVLGLVLGWVVLCA